MYVITGATGQLGSAIVERLLDRVPSSEIGVSVRDPDRAVALAERGVRVRRGGYDDPEALTWSFDGASTVFLVSAPAVGETALAWHRAALDCVGEAGVERVVYIGHQAAAPDSVFPPCRTHAATFELLAERGLAFVGLRNGFYTSTLSWMIGDAVRSGVIVAPEDGPVSWTTHADLATAAALAVLGEGGLDAVTPPLTAAEALDLDAVAAILSDILGRPVRREVIDDEAWAVAAAERGMPELGVAMGLATFRASRRGEFDIVDPTLGRLLGRAPEGIRSTLEQACSV